VVPRGDTLTVGYSGIDSVGSLLYKNSNNTFYYLSTTGWKSIGNNPVQNAGAVKDFNTDATGADSLYAYTVPASYLANNGDKVLFTYAGSFAAIGATSRVVGIAAGGINIVSLSNDITLGGSWKIEGTIIRVSNSVIRFIGQIHFDNTGVAANLSYTVPGEIGGLNLSANGLRLALTVGSPNTNVTAMLGSITYVSAAP
jgi:hypothetical protein